jgi:hypothetical protein
MANERDAICCLLSQPQRPLRYWRPSAPAKPAGPPHSNHSLQHTRRSRNRRGRKWRMDSRGHPDPRDRWQARAPSLQVPLRRHAGRWWADDRRRRGEARPVDPVFETGNRVRTRCEHSVPPRPLGGHSSLPQIRIVCGPFATARRRTARRAGAPASTPPAPETSGQLRSRAKRVVS